MVVEDLLRFSAKVRKLYLTKENSLSLSVKLPPSATIISTQQSGSNTVNTSISQSKVLLQ